MKRPSLEEARQVSRFADTQGWQIIKKYIQMDLETLVNDLINSDSMNLAEISQLRGEIQSFQNLLDWVNARNKQATEN